MDFARRQLEKYGWSAGKGLGKHENGISEALKPKLKRSVTGIGHDAAAEFNEHWWSALYDKAAKNVEVEDKNGKTKKIKTVDTDEFTITNSTWRINKKHKNESDVNEYSDYFIRKAVLTNDGTKLENVSGSDSESEEIVKKDAVQMTDEELFAACEGRTAHKGARHGLRALGKLARIAQQEQVLLTQQKYEAYSHAKKKKPKNEVIFEEASLEDNKDEKLSKKKKRKRCLRNDSTDGNAVECAESSIALPVFNEKKLRGQEVIGDTIKINENDSGRKSRKLKKRILNNEEMDTENNDLENTKKRKREIEQTKTDEELKCPYVPQKKKRKHKNDS